MAIDRGYCTVTDVERLNPRRDYSGVGVLGGNDIEAFVDDVAYEMEAELKSVSIEVPVSSTTSPLAYSILGALNALGAAAKAENAEFSMLNPLGESEHGVKLQLAYDTLLEKILVGRLILDDAIGGPVISRSLAFSGSIDDSDTGEEKDPRFALDTEW